MMIPPVRLSTLPSVFDSIVNHRYYHDVAILLRDCSISNLIDDNRQWYSKQKKSKLFYKLISVKTDEPV